jgi:isoleucyl-tRNA synthetase
MGANEDVRSVASGTTGAAPRSGSLLVAVEERVNAFWARDHIADQALSLNPTGEAFRFTEGPPTANGKPHMGHFLTRAIKDCVLRYKRMRGYRIVTSMAGWDCHGLPVELEVEKAHGWRSKKEIEAYGLANFARECRTSVRTYESLWREMSERVGYWLDYSHAYFTMDNRYIESVWWSLKQLYDHGYLEKGSYIVPYCPRCETPEAAHEVAQGYREADDPSVTIRLKLTGAPSGTPPRYLLVWTTTPWTLPSNLALAIDPALRYVVFAGEEGSEYVMAESAFDRYYPEAAARPKVDRVLEGKELLGLTYEPPFPEVTPKGEGRHKVYPAAFVTAEDGTGIVHIAPSFGADDFALGEEHHLGFFDPLDSSGRFTKAVPLVEGKSFKGADPILSKDLRERSVLWKEERLLHTYPFCYRCGHALIYRALETWFIRTHLATEKLMANNGTVLWVPSHIKNGRFGNFVAEGKDWALSRNRYWGTPLPIWNCPRGHAFAVGAFEELARLAGQPLPADFDAHKPFVDELVLRCPEHGERLLREPYVIDCWYDSGSAPFAQYHHPFEKDPRFDPAQPLDFVAEGLDQTRGWFYSLLVNATLLFDRPAYKSLIVNGMVLDEKGQKQSKSKGNVSDPMVLMATLGADPGRMAMYLGPYTEPMRFSDHIVKTTGAHMLSTLVNVAEFYRENREADQYVFSGEIPHPEGILDRWLLSRLQALSETVSTSLDALDLHTAAASVDRFVEELSTWYLRRSRQRFWNEVQSPDREAAYATLSFTLETLARIVAPLAPHVAEHVYQTATGSDYREGAGSVHLEPWPALVGLRNPPLDEAMHKVLEVVEAGRNLRMKVSVKQRIPLAELVVAGFSAEDRQILGDSLRELLEGELNLKNVTLLSKEEFAVRTFPEAEWAVLATDQQFTVALSRNPSRALVLEGLSREMVRRIQTVRKEMKLRYTDQVSARLYLGPNLLEALAVYRERIEKECQIVSLEAKEGPAEGPGLHEWDDVGGDRMALKLERA